MSRRRRLADDMIPTLVAWWQEYQRVGTFKSKAQELGVDDETLRDAIRRGTGESPRAEKRKVDIDAEVDRILAGS